MAAAAGSIQATALASQVTSGPNWLDSMLEMPRTLAESMALGFALPLLHRAAPAGDGHPVMVLPGFLGGDDSTLALRRFLTRLGYVPLPWLEGTNTGRPEQLHAAARRFYRLQRSTDQKISLVGQSLGGVYAREIAREFPHAVRSVITLGSPFGATGEEETNPMVAQLFERLSGLEIEDMQERLGGIDPRTPLGLPSTAVYSKTDGVVAWQTCLEQVTPLSENIEIRGSHSGMAANPHVLHIIADRLAQPMDRWLKFDRTRAGRAIIFPEPALPAPVLEFA
jgi:pimeloyl-ACP methyl ester carboxylesterase